MKQCKKCNVEKSLDQFYNKKGEPDGKHRYCNTCMRQEKKEYYNLTKDKRADYYKKYRAENKEYFNEYCNNHYHTKKELYREWNREQYKSNPEFKLKHLVIGRIYSALQSYQTLKNDKTVEYLGCSIGEYYEYLKGMFNENMNWDNHGEYWEIDHIKPCSSFNLEDLNEQIKCFHYTNLQPLTISENRKKYNKY